MMLVLFLFQGILGLELYLPEKLRIYQNITKISDEKILDLFNSANKGEKFFVNFI